MDFFFPQDFILGFLPLFIDRNRGDEMIVKDKWGELHQENKQAGFEPA